jgi:hypothetical protein
MLAKRTNLICGSLMAAFMGLSLGCSDVTPSPTEVPAPGPGEEMPPPPPAPTPEPCAKIDFLFVVDDSYSMYEEQSNLAQNFPKFLEVIDNYINSAGSFLDYRLAVTTTGVTTAENNGSGAMNGAFRAGCGLDVPFVQRSDFEVADTFACRAAVGLDGPAVEMPVLATERALSDRIADGTNGDFLRDDALLAVIILTDEDDCANYDGGIADSECHADMADAVAFFDNLKGERSKWALSVIAGETDCSSAFGSADQANRLMEMVNLTGENGVFNSICEGDLTPALTESIDTFSAACENFGIE